MRDQPSAHYAALLEATRERALNFIDLLSSYGINSNADGWLQPTALVIPLEDMGKLAEILRNSGGPDRA